MRSLRIAVLLLAAILCGCGLQDGDDTLQGYVEGDFLDVGAEETARLAALEVRRGDAVEAGTVLFRLDATDAQEALGEAQARVAQARAQLEDMKTGRRQEEIAVLKAQRDQVRANLELARRNNERTAKLHQQNIVSDAQADDAVQRVQGLEAQLASMNSEIDVANLASRPDAILAAEHAVDAAQATLNRVNARIGRLSGTAPMAGNVQDTYYEPGEMVPAGRPVVSVLPPENLKVRFFVPQERFADVRLGEAASISCDGCAGPIPATVTFISKAAEFTPPVIYSVHARQKLVYMVEARPDDVSGLKVGQPVDVRLGP